MAKIKAHCDMVVAVDLRQFGDETPVVVDEGDFLPATVQGAETLFGIMQNRSANPDSEAPIA